MKVAVNVAFVLFMILGAGFVFAGYGVCVTPEPTIRNENNLSYYPSGRLSFSQHYYETIYADGSCVGSEGSCETGFDPGATKAFGGIDEWWYNDTDDDATKLMFSTHTPISSKGRTTCGG